MTDPTTWHVCVRASCKKHASKHSAKAAPRKHTLPLTARKAEEEFRKWLIQPATVTLSTNSLKTASGLISPLHNSLAAMPFGAITSTKLQLRSIQQSSVASLLGLSCLIQCRRKAKLQRAHTKASVYYLGAAGDMESKLKQLKKASLARRLSFWMSARHTPLHCTELM